MNSVVSCDVDNSMISEPQKSKSISKSIHLEGKIESVSKEKKQIVFDLEKEKIEDQKEHIQTSFPG